MSMRRRRWAILASTLVALNVFLWLVPQGLALQRALINQLFGPRMVRAEVVVLGSGGSPQDYRIDRGVVTSATSTAITLSEADGTAQTIPVDAATRVIGMPARLGIARLAPRLQNAHVLVFRLANAPAQTIQVESRGP
jgi:hypothetical protein